MKYILNKLYNRKILSQYESYQLFNSMINNQISYKQLASALIAMKIRGEHPKEILGAVLACLDAAQYFPSPKYIFGDIVGTGGDKSNSINISTISAFVAAICGCKIAKHTNTSISSKSGSADLLKFFGLNLNISAQTSRYMLDNFNICFLLATNYHKIFNYANYVRKKLKTRTLFNIIGPLINPAKPQLALIGVYSYDLILPIIYIMKDLGYQRAAVVHSDGMDEVSLHNNTHLSMLSNGKIINYQLSPKNFGFQFCAKNKVIGGTAKENYEILSKLLQGKGKKEHEEIIAMNVALLMKVFGYENLIENAQKALLVIKNGNVYNLVCSLAKIKDNYDKEHVI